MNPTSNLTNNSFIDRIMKLIPDDPLTQTQYLYYLTLVVFIGIAGYGVTSWYQFFTTFSIKSFFSGLFMTAVALMSLFGVKQTRQAYHSVKLVYSKKIEPEGIEEMLEGFKKQPINENKNILGK